MRLQQSIVQAFPLNRTLCNPRAALYLGLCVEWHVGQQELSSSFAGRCLHLYQGTRQALPQDRRLCAWSHCCSNCGFMRDTAGLVIDAEFCRAQGLYWMMIWHWDRCQCSHAASADGFSVALDSDICLNQHIALQVPLCGAGACCWTTRRPQPLQMRLSRPAGCASISGPSETGSWTTATPSSSGRSLTLPGTGASCCLLSNRTTLGT